MALQFLKEGKKVQDIPVQISQQYVISMRQCTLDKRDIHLPQIVEAFSR